MTKLKEGISIMAIHLIVNIRQKLSDRTDQSGAILAKILNNTITTTTAALQSDAFSRRTVQVQRTWPRQRSDLPQVSSKEQFLRVNIQNDLDET